MARIIKGTLLAAVGLFLVLLGVSVGFMPFGRTIGESFGTMSQHCLLPGFGALLGFATTWGEPAVRVLAGQVEAASAGSIRDRVFVAIAVDSGGVATGPLANTFLLALIALAPVISVMLLGLVVRMKGAPKEAES